MRASRVKYSLWISGLGLLGIVLVISGGVWPSRPKPNYEAFRADISHVMKNVEPLPKDLVVLDEWEDCGQGSDPFCDGLVLLVDDPSRREPPIGSIRRRLLNRGWLAHPEEPDLLRQPYMGERTEPGSVELRFLTTVATKDQSARLKRFLRQHSAEGVAYLYVRP